MRTPPRGLHPQAYRCPPKRVNFRAGKNSGPLTAGDLTSRAHRLRAAAAAVLAARAAAGAGRACSLAGRAALLAGPVAPPPPTPAAGAAWHPDPRGAPVTPSSSFTK